MISTDYNKHIPRIYGSKENQISPKLPCKISSLDRDCVSFGADYKKTGNITEYIKENSTEEEIITALKDAQSPQRSLFGYKKKIAGVFLSAKDKKTAALNLNVLLNAKNQTLKAREIFGAISTMVNAANYNPADDLAKYLHK